MIYKIKLLKISLIICLLFFFILNFKATLFYKQKLENNVCYPLIKFTQKHTGYNDPIIIISLKRIAMAIKYYGHRQHVYEISRSHISELEEAVPEAIESIEEALSNNNNIFLYVPLPHPEIFIDKINDIVVTQYNLVFEEVFAIDLDYMVYPLRIFKTTAGNNSEL